MNHTQALARARELAAAPGRTLLGLAGAPGCGKSTLAATIAAALPGAVVVPMDGFHLDTARLAELGRVGTRGAPDTFDAAGYVALLHRLRTGGDVPAPDFDRTAEEPVADAIAVPADATLVVTEGNYLLLPTSPWGEVAGLLDETWFVQVPEAVREQRLIARFVGFGMPAARADHRVRLGSDAANARLVAPTRCRADVVVTENEAVSNATAETTVG